MKIRPLLLLIALSGCAEDLPGVVPPGDQLYYPTGLALLPGSPDTLAVCNSNFDQRYNAGSIIALPIDQLFANTALFVDTVPAVANGFVRVQNFCGDLIATPSDGGGAGEYRLYAAIRGRNRLTMVKANNGALNCKTSIASPVLGTDCTPAYSVRTNFGDPFAVAYGQTATVSVVAVGHLLTQQNDRGGDLITGVAHANTATFDERILAEQGGANPDDKGGAVLQRFNNISGTNTMVYVPGEAIGSEHGTFLAGGRRVGLDTRTTAALVGFEIRRNGGIIDLTAPLGLNLQDEAGVQEVRGIVLSNTSTRAYVSVRFDGAGGTTNSGLAVVAIGPGSLRVLAVAEAGDELGSPALIERMIGTRMARVVYVPDLRGDAIWVFDVSTDEPELIAKIDGRAPRTRSDGKQIIAHTLDAPTKIVFVEREGRTLGFVSNFANSTLSVIDASNPLAPEIEVIARFGQALTPDGKNEGDE